MAKTIIETIDKKVELNPEEAIVIEQKIIGREFIRIYHYLTFKVVVVSQGGVVKSVNIIDRELCVCDKNG